MSNQGWGRPRGDRSTGEKVFDAVTWPIRAVFWGVVTLVMRRRRK